MAALKTMIKYMFHIFEFKNLLINEETNQYYVMKQCILFSAVMKWNQALHYIHPVTPKTQTMHYYVTKQTAYQCYFSCCFLVSVSVKVLDHKIFQYKFFQLLLSFSYFFSVSISATIMIFQFQFQFQL